MVLPSAFCGDSPKFSGAERLCPRGDDSAIADARTTCLFVSSVQYLLRANLSDERIAKMSKSTFRNEKNSTPSYIDYIWLKRNSKLPKGQYFAQSYVFLVTCFVFPLALI